MRTAQQLEQAFREFQGTYSEEVMKLIVETLETLQYREKELASYKEINAQLWKFQEKVEEALREFEES